MGLVLSIYRVCGGTRPQMLFVAAWVWFCLSTEFAASGMGGGYSSPGKNRNRSGQRCALQLLSKRNR